MENREPQASAPPRPARGRREQTALDCGGLVGNAAGVGAQRMVSCNPGSTTSAPRVVQPGLHDVCAARTNLDLCVLG